jgi:hypothetical protein
VDWHNPEHPEAPERRLGRWRARGTTIADIQAEIDASTALCRACHMAEDGRADTWHEASPRNKPQAEVPCAVCHEAPAFARGLCRRCYARLNYRAKRSPSPTPELFDHPSRDDADE